MFEYYIIYILAPALTDLEGLLVLLDCPSEKYPSFAVLKCLSGSSVTHNWERFQNKSECPHLHDQNTNGKIPNSKHNCKKPGMSVMSSHAKSFRSSAKKITRALARFRMFQRASARFIKNKINVFLNIFE